MTRIADRKAADGNPHYPQVGHELPVDQQARVEPGRNGARADEDGDRHEDTASQHDQPCVCNARLFPTQHQEQTEQKHHRQGRDHQPDRRTAEAAPVGGNAEEPGNEGGRCQQEPGPQEQREVDGQKGEPREEEADDERFSNRVAISLQARFPETIDQRQSQSHGRRQGVERALPGLGQVGEDLDRDHSDDGPGQQPERPPRRPLGPKRNPQADDEAVTGRRHHLDVVSARRIAERNDDEENAGADQHAPPSDTHYRRRARNERTTARRVLPIRRDRAFRYIRHRG